MVPKAFRLQVGWRVWQGWSCQTYFTSVWLKDDIIVENITSEDVVYLAASRNDRGQHIFATHCVAKPLYSRYADSAIKYTGTERHAMAHVQKADITLHLSISGHVKHCLADIKSLHICVHKLVGWGIMNLLATFARPEHWWCSTRRCSKLRLAWNLCHEIEIWRTWEVVWR